MDPAAQLGCRRGSLTPSLLTTTAPSIHLHLPEQALPGPVPTQLASHRLSHPLAWRPFKDNGSISSILCSARAQSWTQRRGKGGRGNRGLGGGLCENQVRRDRLLGDRLRGRVRGSPMGQGSEGGGHGYSPIFSCFYY